VWLSRVIIVLHAVFRKVKPDFRARNLLFISLIFLIFLATISQILFNIFCNIYSSVKMFPWSIPVKFCFDYPGNICFLISKNARHFLLNVWSSPSSPGFDTNHNFSLHLHCKYWIGDNFKIMFHDDPTTFYTHPLLRPCILLLFIGIW
jgi:hypothetical protein